uniref:AC4 n=1 Tax=Romanomermis culicivorax TaxID=13658 RepID=A0A915HVY8_ROMCU
MICTSLSKSPASSTTRTAVPLDTFTVTPSHLSQWSQSLHVRPYEMVSKRSMPVKEITNNPSSNPRNNEYCSIPG